LQDDSDEQAAAKACEALDKFLQKIGMWLSLKNLGVTMEEVSLIADNSRVLPDYKNNPRIASRDEIFEMLQRSFTRD
jgi:alcohol dehydrogenase class IV